MKFYHATDSKNIKSIQENGIKMGFDGCVYMTKKPEESLRFLALRFLPKMAVFTIDIPDKDMDKVEETFDHSESFFKCRAYGYIGDIPMTWVKLYGEYTRG